LFALGAILYEGLLGRPPFEGSAVALTREVDASPPFPEPLPEDVRGRLLRISRRCLARKRTERYPSAKALASALEQVLRESPDTYRGRGWLLALLLVALAVAASLAVLALG
jgi:serine/threonine protein kinase